MPALAIITGAILDAMGILGFVLTGAKSMTALIPSLFGTIIVLCGLIALLRPAARKHAMHSAVAVALVGFLGGILRSGPKLPALFAGQPVEPSAVAIWMQFSFALICLAFVAAGIHSFIKARLAAGGKPLPD
jgi:hypothetical protein